MRCLVVVNPGASRAPKAGLARTVATACRRHGLAFEVVTTKGPGDAAALVEAQRADFDTLLVCGGDGTLHEALQALDLERHAVGVVPAGTGNDFAWMNGWPRSADTCVARLVRGRPQRLDLGLWGGRRFHNSIGLGFEGRVNYESRRIRRLRGPAVYLAAVARTLARREPYPLRLDWGDGAWEGEVFMASVCIGQRVGGAFRLAPQARNDDGLFDLCFAVDMGLLRILALLPRTFRGGHLASPHVHLRRAASLRIHAPRGVPVHVDGEFVGLEVQNLDLHTLPGGLRTYAPES